MDEQDTLRMGGLTEEEAATMLGYQAWQLNRARIRIGLVGRYKIDETCTEPWPRLKFHPMATWALGPLPPPSTPLTYAMNVCEKRENN